MARTEIHETIYRCDICAKVERDRIDAPMPRGWFLIAQEMREKIVCGQDCGVEAVQGMGDEHDRWEAERARLEGLQHAGIPAVRTELSA